jgi:hypothetical protein
MIMTGIIGGRPVTGPVTDVQLIRNTIAAARGAIRARAA